MDEYERLFPSEENKEGQEGPLLFSDHDLACVFQQYKQAKQHTSSHLCVTAPH